MRRIYTLQRAAPRGRRRCRRAQQGQGIFDFVKKVARNPVVKSIAKKGLQYAPGVYHNLTKRVKNKTLKRILDSDAAHLSNIVIEVIETVFFMKDILNVKNTNKSI